MLLVTFGFYGLVFINISPSSYEFSVSTVGSWLFLIMYIVIILALGLIVGYISFLLVNFLFSSYDYRHLMLHDIKLETKFTFLLPVADISERILTKMVNSIFQQDYPRELLQIIVILKAQTLDIAKFDKFNNLPNFDLVIQDPNTTGYKAGGLNSVLDMITGSLVVIIDKNHILEPNLCKSFLTTYLNNSDPHLGYIQAATRYYHSNSIISRFGAVLRHQLYFFYIYARSAIGNAQFNGSTCCFTFEMLKDLGEFPTYSYTENSATSVAIKLLGYKGIFLPELLTSCPSRQSKEQTISQLYRWSHGLASVVKHEWKPILSSPEISPVQKYDVLMYHAASTPASSAIIYLPLLFILRLSFDLVGVVYFQEGIFINYMVSCLFLLLIIPFISFVAEKGIVKAFYELPNIILFLLVSLTFPIYLQKAFSEGWHNNRGPSSADSSWSFSVPTKKYDLLLVVVILLELIVIIITRTTTLHVIWWFLIGFCCSQFLVLIAK